MKYKSRPPIFVIGSPRSGTTVLSEIISSMPYSELFHDILITPHIVHKIADGISSQDYEFYICEIRANIESAIRQQRQRRILLLAKLLKGKISLKEFSHSILLKTRLDSNFYENIRFIYHEPFLTMNPELILDIFPEAKIVHIIRDPRACASSLIQSYNAFSDELILNMQNSNEIYSQIPEIGIIKSIKEKRVPYWVDKSDIELFIEGPNYLRAYLLWEYLEKSCYEKVSNSTKFNKTNYILLQYNDFVSKPKLYVNKLNDFLEANIAKGEFNRLNTKSINKYKNFIDEKVIKIIECRYAAIKKNILNV